VEEFISNGYDVDVYAFSRGFDLQNTNLLNYEIIGEFENGSSIKKRFPIMRNAMKRVFKKYSNKDVIYYIFQVDVALFFRFYNRKGRYIYEESDLSHTYMSSRLLRNVLEKFDCNTIKKSVCTVLTSEGFAKYHFGSSKPENVFIIPNRLNARILSLPAITKREVNIDKLKIGFVGHPRFESVKNFAKVICEKFPQHEFHIYGEPLTEDFKFLKKYPNFFFHGAFINPEDLPEIYSKIDLVLSTYDTKYENVRYAEPNKIYEAIYFETPIIVSNGTFLETKVNKLGIGYSVDPMDDDAVISLINSLTNDSIEERIKRATAIPKEDAININTEFFQGLAKLLKSRTM
jgi:glycosyltransferase involved in cell wall biosynthesis